MSDIWAFGSTLVAGLVVVWTGWLRADAVATLVVAVLMAWTGSRLVHEAGRVFLEAAPAHLDPASVGDALIDSVGVAEVHDLHIWMLGPRDTALSAHVLVDPTYDCHAVSAELRTMLAADYGIGHVTLQADHADAPTHDAEHCADAHGAVRIAPARSSSI